MDVSVTTEVRDLVKVEGRDGLKVWAFVTNGAIQGEIQVDGLSDDTSFNSRSRVWRLQLDARRFRELSLAMGLFWEQVREATTHTDAGYQALSGGKGEGAGDLPGMESGGDPGVRGGRSLCCLCDCMHCQAPEPGFVLKLWGRAGEAWDWSVAKVNGLLFPGSAR